MLQLASNWHMITFGRLADHLVSQEPSPALRLAIAANLVHASLDVTVGARRAAGYADVCVQLVYPRSWRIGDLIYRLLSEGDDRSAALSQRPRQARIATLIVPIAWEAQMRRHLHAAPWITAVFTVGSFLDWRMLFDAIDLGYTRAEAVLALAAAYNARVEGGGCGKSLLIEIPRRVPA